jgi:hypothetical protein
VPFSHRTLVILALGAVVACGGGHPGTAPSPSAPAETVERFVAAVNANDLDAMATLWGDEQGPSNVTTRNSRTVRIRQLTIFQRLLQSDTHQIVETDVADQMKPRVSVLFTRGGRRFTVPFTLVRSRYGGWLVQQMDLTPAMPAAGSAPR